MKNLLVFVLFLGTWALGQESRPQMSVRVAGEEAAATQTPKPKQQTKPSAEKQSAQKSPRPATETASKKPKRSAARGWCGKWGK